MTKKGVRIYSSKHFRSSKGVGRRRKKARNLLKKGKGRRYFSGEKFEKFMWVSLGILGVCVLVGSIAFLFYLQRITKQLPSVENPFDKEASSTIYDRNGVVLYKVSQENLERDLLKPDEYVPEALKWAFLSAEDEQFYNHQGVDFSAILRCVVLRFVSDTTCGGSTITQQVIINTVIDREYSYTRKIKDIILALQLERLYEKDEILNIYLNVVPQGSHIKGIKRGADFYFGKSLEELSYAEMAVIAAVVQNPTRLSPTVGSDVESNIARLEHRTDYLLDQMIENMDKINARIRDANEANKAEDGFIEEKEIKLEDLKKAKEEVRNLEYKPPLFDIKAPHFVFYVRKLLTERPYNNGVAFEDGEIEVGGYNIYTTLDYGLQEVAEEFVGSSEPKHAGFYRDKYQAHNSALMTMRPETGEILTMVGSKCYKDNEYIPNCSELDEEEGDLFDSNVNVLDTLQSPGSTNKALGYYLAFKEGLVSPGSYIPDVPISIGSYKPKNWNGKFNGRYTVREAFAQSINIPALFLIQRYGINTYLDTAREWGYTTYTNPSGYGQSVVLGGGDIKAIEHAQAFGIFANGGSFVEHEVISKITDIDGNIIYQHEPEKIEIADPQAVYMVNNVLNPRYTASSPVKSIRGRDVAGKTGTSEDSKDTWFSMWSPEFVTIGWMGNNDNTSMSRGAFGSTSVEPWVGAYMKALENEFPTTPFTRPSGIVSSCSGESEEACDSSDIAIAGKVPPSYLKRKTVQVCVDQPDRLAREIDIATDNTVSKTFTYLESVVPTWQGFVDEFYNRSDVGEGGVPTEECDIDRGASIKDRGIIYSPKPGLSYKNTLPVNVKALEFGSDKVKEMRFSLDGRTIGSTKANVYEGNLNISSTREGSVEFRLDITYTNNKKYSSSVRIYVGNENPGKIGLAASSTSTRENRPVLLTASYNSSNSRSDLNSVSVYEVNKLTGSTQSVGTMRKTSSNKFEFNWVTSRVGTYEIYVVGRYDNQTVSSSPVSINVTRDQS